MMYDRPDILSDSRPCDICGEGQAETIIHGHPVHEQCWQGFAVELAEHYEELHGTWQTELDKEAA